MEMFSFGTPAFHLERSPRRHFAEHTARAAQPEELVSWHPFVPGWGEDHTPSIGGVGGVSNMYECCTNAVDYVRCAGS